MKPRVLLAWKVVFASALGVCALLLAIGLFWLAAFALVWGVGVGLVLWRNIEKIHAALGRARLLTYPGFALVVVVVSVAEETLCAGFGCTLAVANYFVDLVVVVPMWLVWLTGWYFLVAPRFAFEYEEALLVAAVTGIMFEIVGNGRFLADPLASALSVPLVIVVYMAITAIPIRMIPFSGTRTGLSKYPFAFFVPWVLVLPAVLPIFIVGSLLGVL